MPPELQTKQTTAQANAGNRFMNMSMEELLAYRREHPEEFPQQQGGGAMETLRGVGDIWAGGKSFTFDPTTGRPYAVETGVKRPAAGGDMNEFIMKEMIKQRIKQPTEITDLPEGYERGFSKKGEPIITPIKAKPYTERYNEALKGAVTGETTFEDVKREFPKEIEKTEKLRTQHTPVTKAEGFQFTRNPLEAFRNEQKAMVPNAKTNAVLRNIKNEKDLNEFMENIDEYRDAGVDVNAVLEYFGKR